ncbi:hypothetical protein FNV43_RR00735 [Rhamnella rubrinervis]|uniref:Uncharacterized protein n=1 Tax=Rhamnella rubrinervis TaxID=2594499 RepID=A0A8K0HNC5_9ROSA|nr:hypothetical protein FNV43_RR00735 [Rhamnella rubrinervis]
MLDSLAQKEDSLDRDRTEVSEIIEMMNDAFSNELGPVSVTAQLRVPVPDGLLLKQNLEDLETICPDVQPPSLNSFSFGSLHSEERMKNEIGSNDYPPANDLKSESNMNYDAEDLVKLTDLSLVPKTKPNHAKTRPVVVKLDEGDQWPLAAKLQPKEASLSGAVRDVLLGSDTKSLSQSKPSDESSNRRKGKEKLNVDSPSESKESWMMLNKMEKTQVQEKPNTINMGKRHRSTGNVVDKGDENVQKGMQNSSHRHGKHKARQKLMWP